METKYLCILFSILLFWCTSLVQAQDILPPQPIAESALNLSDGIEYKKTSDIDQRLRAVKDSKVEDIAQAIAEVDEWIYIKEDEESARKKIENEIEKLRTRIEAEVTRLLKEAPEAKTGKEAHGKISAVNSLLSFYPAPKTDKERASLEKITSNILSTSRRIEDIRRLRYNEWAILQIQGSLEYYRYESRIVGVDLSNLNGVKNLSEAKDKLRSELSEAKFSKNKEALVKACINWMSPIDPAFLEPVVMDLYNYVYSLTRDAVGDDDMYRIRLTKGFANPSTIRQTPSDK